MFIVRKAEFSLGSGTDQSKSSGSDRINNIEESLKNQMKLNNEATQKFDLDGSKDR